MWVVMTSQASMPSSCMGRYANVAMVKLHPHYVAWGKWPKMISSRARGVLELQHFGHHNVGKTERCKFQRMVKLAQERCDKLNESAPIAQAELLATWGGSA